MAPLAVGLLTPVRADAAIRAFHCEASKHVNTRSARVYTTEIELWGRLGCTVWVRVNPATRTYSLGVGSVSEGDAVEWIHVLEPFDAVAGTKLARVAQRVWWHNDTAAAIAPLYSTPLIR